MYIRTTKNQRGESYYHLVESYRYNGQVKQRTLLSLGKVGEGKLEQLAKAISKHIDTTKLFAMIKDVDVKDTYILGPLLVLEHMVDVLGINSCLAKVGQEHEQLGFDFVKVVFTQICSRFVKPVSKLALYDKWIERLYPVMVNHDIALQHIYRSLNILANHKEQIEMFLYGYEKDLFSMTTDVVLYDLTTLRFESTREDLDSYRRFGYSKEKRNDCTQVVLGLLTDTDGIPLSFEVHPGNTFEGKTLDGIVDKMRSKFSIRRFIFIADRGLFSSHNLEHIRQSQGEFIVGLRIGSLEKQRKAEFYNINNFTYINRELACYETAMGGDRCIITWSKSRAERDRKAREEVIDKINEKLASKKPVSKTFITNKAYQKYVIVNDKNNCSLNHRAVADDAAKDGFFGIITNVKTMTAAEIVSNYKQLWKIEDSFGEIKGTLKSRPMFHWSDGGILGHLVLCFLTYLCEAHMTKYLRLSNENLHAKSIENKIVKQRPLSVVQAMDELNHVMAVPVKIKTNTFWFRTDIHANAQALLKAIGMRIPPKLLSKQADL